MILDGKTAAFNAQYQFLRENVPFYRSYYPPAKAFVSYEEALQGTPLVSKSQMRACSPFDFLPNETRSRLHEYTLHRGTGGSTGAPTSILYSRPDWDSATRWGGAWIARELRDVRRPLLAFNNYNQGHVSGPAFNDFFRVAGGFAICRNFGADDAHALQQMESHGCSVLVAPPTSTHKGGTLESLLEADARRSQSYIHGDNIDAIVVSSTSITNALRSELRALGIERVIDFYGSTDVLPVAASCARCDALHIADGFLHAAVLGEGNRHVKPGERGIVVAGRIANEVDGIYQPSKSTGLLTFLMGDSAQYQDGQCSAGRIGPALRGIQRVADIEEKVASGCQTW